MSDSYELEGYPDRTIADMLTAWEMPDDGVSERTRSTRTIGAYLILEHLMSGELRPESADLRAEFLVRLAANEERQEITPDDDTPE